MSAPSSSAAGSGSGSVSSGSNAPSDANLIAVLSASNHKELFEGLIQQWWTEGKHDDEKFYNVANWTSEDVKTMHRYLNLPKPKSSAKEEYHQAIVHDLTRLRSGRNDKADDRETPDGKDDEKSLASQHSPKGSSPRKPTQHRQAKKPVSYEESDADPITDVSDSDGGDEAKVLRSDALKILKLASGQNKKPPKKKPPPETKSKATTAAPAPSLVLDGNTMAQFAALISAMQKPSSAKANAKSNRGKDNPDHSSSDSDDEIKSAPSSLAGSDDESDYDSDADDGSDSSSEHSHTDSSEGSSSNESEDFNLSKKDQPKSKNKHKAKSKSSSSKDGDSKFSALEYKAVQKFVRNNYNFSGYIRHQTQKKEYKRFIAIWRRMHGHLGRYVNTLDIKSVAIHDQLVFLAKLIEHHIKDGPGGNLFDEVVLRAFKRFRYLVVADKEGWDVAKSFDPTLNPVSEIVSQKELKRAINWAQKYQNANKQDNRGQRQSGQSSNSRGSGNRRNWQQRSQQSGSQSQGSGAGAGARTSGSAPNNNTNTGAGDQSGSSTRTGP